jgi:hypothetical protein
MNSDAATGYAWKPLCWFFGLSFVIAWSIWLAIGFAMPDLKSSVGTFITVPGAWAPTLSALVLTAKFNGREAVRDLLRQVIRWRFRWWWYVIAILAPTALALVSVGIVVVLGEPAPSLEAIASGLGMPAEPIALLVGFPLCTSFSSLEDHSERS